MDSLLAEDPKSRRYEKVAYFDEGQFALVYKARDTRSGQFVAIKKVKCGSREDIADGVNRTALREIKLLRELQHENVIGLLDVFGEEGNVNLVFEIMVTDLEKLIRDTGVVLTASNIKNLLLQTLRGLDYLHQNYVLHRDIKSNNIFVSGGGQLKLGDFGLARVFGSPNRPLTNQVVTRWYRAPELLLGARMYGAGVDMWAAGCVFAELLRRAPLFPGESDLMQLSKVYDILGTPTEEDWPQAKQLSNYVEFTVCSGVPLQQIFTAATDDLLQLMCGLLQLNPDKRLSAQQCLQLPYFTLPPLPSPNSALPLGNAGAAASFDISRQQQQQQQQLRANGSAALLLDGGVNGSSGPVAKRLCFSGR